MITRIVFLSAHDRIRRRDRPHVRNIARKHTTMSEWIMHSVTERHRACMRQICAKFDVCQTSPHLLRILSLFFFFFPSPPRTLLAGSEAHPALLKTLLASPEALHAASVAHFLCPLRSRCPLTTKLILNSTLMKLVRQREPLTM